MPVEGFNAFMPNDAIMVGTKDITLWFCICIGFVIAFNTRQKILGELHIQGNNSKKKKFMVHTCGTIHSFFVKVGMILIFEEKLFYHT